MASCYNLLNVGRYSWFAASAGINILGKELEEDPCRRSLKPPSNRRLPWWHVALDLGAPVDHATNRIRAGGAERPGTEFSRGLRIFSSRVSHERPTAPEGDVFSARKASVA